MLNKKRIGLGMLVAGGAIAVVGAVVARKGFKEDKELKLVEDLNSPCGMETSCDVCGYCDHYENPDNFKEDEVVENVEESDIEIEELVAVPASKEIRLDEKGEVLHTTTEWEPSNKDTADAHISTSAYNPMAEPSSMSQADLEAIGMSTL